LVGIFITFHHRARQKEKFQIIKIYEQELGLTTFLKPVIIEAKKGFFGKIDTFTFIYFMQVGLR